MEEERKKTEEDRDARRKYMEQAHGREQRRGEQTQEEREGRHRQREETLAVKDKEKEVDAIKVWAGEEGYIKGMGWGGGIPYRYGLGRRDTLKVWAREEEGYRVGWGGGHRGKEVAIREVIKMEYWKPSNVREGWGAWVYGRVRSDWVYGGGGVLGYVGGVLGF